MNDKLQRGLKQLAEAGHDKDKLGMALISLHGALEEYFRSQLAAEIVADENAQGRRRTDWQDLLNLWQEHRTLSPHDRELIYAKNSKRNAVAHGDPFEISRNEMEIYAQFVEKFMGIPRSSYDVVADQPESFRPQPTAVANPPFAPKKGRSCLSRLVMALVLLGFLGGGCYWSVLYLLNNYITTENGGTKAEALPEIFDDTPEAVITVVPITAEPIEEIDNFSENDSKITPPGAATSSSVNDNNDTVPKLRVVGNSYVRSGPETDSEVIGTVLDAEEYEIIEISADGDWYKIELATGQEGWLGSTRATQIFP